MMKFKKNHHYYYYFHFSLFPSFFKKNSCSSFSILSLTSTRLEIIILILVDILIKGAYEGRCHTVIMEHFTKRVNVSVIRQKGESQNGCFKETKHAKFSEKRTFLTP